MTSKVLIKDRLPDFFVTTVSLTSLIKNVS